MWLDELFDLADRMPADDSVRVTSLTATPIPAGKDGKQEGVERLELKLGATNTGSAIALQSAFVHDNPTPNKYYANTITPPGGPLPASHAPHILGFTLRATINHREPGQYERNPPPPQKRKTSGGAGGGAAMAARSTGRTGTGADPGPVRANSRTRTGSRRQKVGSRSPLEFGSWFFSSLVPAPPNHCPRARTPMNSREQTLAIILIGAMVATVAGGGGYYFIIRPLAKYNQAEAALNQEVDDLDKQLKEQEAMKERLKTARARSLPADVTLVNREYVVALEHMAESSGVPKTGITITEKKVDSSARNVPEITKGKPIYTRVAFEVVFKKVDMKILKEFFQRYYEFGLLHQITALLIKKDEDPGAKNANPRANLTVIFTTEAIIVEGAENRKTLLPVPTAFGRGRWRRAVPGGRHQPGSRPRRLPARANPHALAAPPRLQPHRPQRSVLRAAPGRVARKVPTGQDQRREGQARQGTRPHPGEGKG